MPQRHRGCQEVQTRPDFGRTLHHQRHAVLQRACGIGSTNDNGLIQRQTDNGGIAVRTGQILVVPFTTNDTLPFMREAAGIITEEAGTNSHSAIVGLTLDKAVIVGATNATRTLKDGMTISMDCARGVVQAMAK